MDGDGAFRFTRARIEYVWDGDPVVLSYERLADGSVLLVDSANDWSATVRDEDAAMARFFGMLMDRVATAAGDDVAADLRSLTDEANRAIEERG